VTDESGDERQMSLKYSEQVTDLTPIAVSGFNCPHARWVAGLLASARCRATRVNICCTSRHKKNKGSVYFRLWPRSYSCGYWVYP